MSKEEAEMVIKGWLEKKMLWFKDADFEDKQRVYEAINVLGEDEVARMTSNLKKIMEDD